MLVIVLLIVIFGYVVKDHYVRIYYCHFGRGRVGFGGDEWPHSNRYLVGERTGRTRAGPGGQPISRLGSSRGGRWSIISETDRSWERILRCYWCVMHE